MFMVKENSGELFWNHDIVFIEDILNIAESIIYENLWTRKLTQNDIKNISLLIDPEYREFIRNVVIRLDNIFHVRTTSNEELLICKLLAKIKGYSHKITDRVEMINIQCNYHHSECTCKWVEINWGSAYANSKNVGNFMVPAKNIKYIELVKITPLSKKTT